MHSCAPTTSQSITGAGSRFLSGAEREQQSQHQYSRADPHHRDRVILAGNQDGADQERAGNVANALVQAVKRACRSLPITLRRLRMRDVRDDGRLDEAVRQPQHRQPIHPGQPGQVQSEDRRIFQVLQPQGPALLNLVVEFFDLGGAVNGCGDFHHHINQLGSDGNDTTGAEGTLARIVEVTARETVLRRTADDDDPHERPIVANADQLVVVAALADPPPRPGMIDRILVAAYDAGLEPLLVFTKADLEVPDDLVGIYAPLGLRIIVMEPGADLDSLRAALRGHRSVLVGHSGVGKSTLVNLLIPGVERATGEVNEVTGRGRHTSTSAIALELPSSGGWVIDTPGLRSFGLSHVTPASIIEAFTDLAEVVADCPRGCQHDSGASECALDAAVQGGRLTRERVESFRRIEGAWMTPTH